MRYGIAVTADTILSTVEISSTAIGAYIILLQEDSTYIIAAVVLMTSFVATTFKHMLPVFIMAIEDDSDRQFAAELYHSYHSIMHQKALSILKKEDLAEDAVQDAMLKIICHLDKIREIPKREIPFYLIAITQTTCIDRYRKIQREKQACVMGYEDDGAKDFSDPKTPEKVFIHTDQIKLLNCCLKELPQREIDLLYYFYTMELSGKEIARLMGMTENAIRMALTRARRKVLFAYRKKGGDDYE